MQGWASYSTSFLCRKILTVTFLHFAWDAQGWHLAPHLFTLCQEWRGRGYLVKAASLIEHSCSPEAQLSSPTYTTKTSGWTKTIPTELVPALAWVQGRPILASQDEARTPKQLNTCLEECKFCITPEHNESLGWEQNQGWAPCIK